MTKRIIFMTEEESMEKALRELLPRLFQGFREYEHWLILDHEGKTDLEKSYPRKMKQWLRSESDARFMILRDNDGADCSHLKQQLISKVPSNAPEYLVRIVCQELESWFMGDLEAVKAAYPAAARHKSFKKLAKIDPDTLTNASELIRELTGTGAKRVRAMEIATHMQPIRNRSKSFQVFVAGVAKFLSE